MIEVGEYIRTNGGNIYQIRKIEKSISAIGQTIYWVKEFYLLKEDIKSHKKDIRDLIEEGDYVNGDEVIAIDHNEDENGNTFNVLGVYDIDDDYAYTIELSRIHIRTILTHEQYEQNCYKVGVENE